MTAEEKKKLAKSLYLAGEMTNKEIAQVVKVSEKTISGKDGWVKKNKWDVIKAADESTKPEIIANLYLNIAEIQEKARDENRPLSNAESDQIVKISNSIEKLQGKIGLQVYIQVFKEFNSFLSSNNPKLLKPNNIWQKEFITRRVHEA